MKIISFPTKTLALLFFLFLTSACAKDGPSVPATPLVRDDLTVEVDEKFVPSRINSVVLYPVTHGATANASSDILGLATKFMTEAFSRNTSLELLNERAPEIVDSHLERIQSRPLSVRDKVSQLAAEVDAQGVLFAEINRYVENHQDDPVRYSAGAPGGVSMTIRLLDAKRDVVVWKAVYSHQNKPLSENLLEFQNKVRDGIRYRSASQLLQQGFVKAAGKLEELRLNSIQ